MSRAERDALFTSFDQYINTMSKQGRKPSALYVTRRQWNQLGLDVYFGKDETPRYKGIEVRVHG